MNFIQRHIFRNYGDEILWKEILEYFDNWIKEHFEILHHSAIVDSRDFLRRNEIFIFKAPRISTAGELAKRANKKGQYIWLNKEISEILNKVYLTHDITLKTNCYGYPMHNPSTHLTLPHLLNCAKIYYMIFIKTLSMHSINMHVADHKLTWPRKSSKCLITTSIERYRSKKPKKLQSLKPHYLFLVEHPRLKIRSPKLTTIYHFKKNLEWFGWETFIQENTYLVCLNTRKYRKNHINTHPDLSPQITPE